MIAPPTQFVFEVASICNLRCPQCWIGLRWTDRSKDKYLMPMELFEKACNEIEPFAKHVYLHLWGEPTLHPKLSDMIKRVKRFATIDLATHGLFVTPENAPNLALCDSLSVSIDGADQETYQKYRVGGKYERAIEGLKLLAKAAPNRVNWTFVTFKDNEHQIPIGYQIAKEIGVNFGPKPPIFWDRSKMNTDMPSSEVLRRYVFRDGEWHLKADRLKCREFWTTSYLLPSGDVLSCCYDGNSEWIMGNLNKDSFLDIWNGAKYNSFRDKHLGGNLNDLCLKHCQLPPN